MRLPTDEYLMAGLSAVLLGWGAVDVLKGVYLWGASDFAFAVAGAGISAWAIRKRRKQGVRERNQELGEILTPGQP